MPTLTVDDYEKAYYLSVLGVSALPTDTMNDLRYKYYKGVVEGSIVIGGGGGGVEQGTFDGISIWGLGMPDGNVTARIDTDIVPDHLHYSYYYFKTPKPVRLRRIGRDYYNLGGAPTGAGSRYAIYNATSPLKVGTRFSGTAPLATFPIANGFSLQVIDVTLPAGGYFLVGHHDYAGATTLGQRKFYVANRSLMASEQTSYVVADSGTVAWPGTFPNTITHTITPTGISGLIGAVPGATATAVLGWDAA